MRGTPYGKLSGKYLFVIERKVGFSSRILRTGLNSFKSDELQRGTVERV